MNQYKQCALLALSFLMVSSVPAFAADEATTVAADKTTISAGDTAASGITETTEVEEQDAADADVKTEADVDAKADLNAAQSEKEVENTLKHEEEESAVNKAPQMPAAPEQPITGQNKQPITPAAPVQPDASNNNPEGKPLRGEAAPAVDPAGSSPNVKKLFSTFHAESQTKQADATTETQPSEMGTEKN